MTSRRTTQRPEVRREPCPSSRRFPGRPLACEQGRPTDRLQVPRGFVGWAARRRRRSNSRDLVPVGVVVAAVVVRGVWILTRKVAQREVDHFNSRPLRQHLPEQHAPDRLLARGPVQAAVRPLRTQNKIEIFGHRQPRPAGILLWVGSAAVTDWTGIRERVLALAAAPGSDKVFGAGAHGFALEAPLTAAEVAEVEAWLGIELPEDYRSFLTQVGAGGAGPNYGIFPVRRDGSAGWRWIGDNPDGVDAGILADPFPGGNDPAAVAEILSERPRQEDFEDPADFDVELDEWQQRLNVTQYDPRFVPGALCLSDEGCGLLVWLAVTGSERGRMWRDPRCDYEDFHPVLATDGSPLNFAAWYLGWLTATEAVSGT